MPDLHEQVETLERRGMPKHPTLTFEECGEFLVGGKVIPDMRWVLEPSKQTTPDELLHPTTDDACDLITMWALRWYYDADFSSFYEAKCKSLFSSNGIEASFPMTIESIIHATQHLEPVDA